MQLIFLKKIEIESEQIEEESNDIFNPNEYEIAMPATVSEAHEYNLSSR
jgi:hypothetical protein